LIQVRLLACQTMLYWNIFLWG